MLTADKLLFYFCVVSCSSPQKPSNSLAHKKRREFFLAKFSSPSITQHVKVLISKTEFLWCCSLLSPSLSLSIHIDSFEQCFHLVCSDIFSPPFFFSSTLALHLFRVRLLESLLNELWMMGVWLLFVRVWVSTFSCHSNSAHPSEQQTTQTNDDAMAIQAFR